MKRTSKLVGCRVGRLDLTGHLLAVESRAASEISQQVAGEILAVPCGLVVFVGWNVDDERIFLHGRFPLVEASLPPPRHLRHLQQSFLMIFNDA